MKTIVLFRHAKSDWDADYDRDHNRPLAERGVKGARKMGRFLVTSGLSPDRALTSTAVRARQTLAIAAEHGGWNGPATVTEALYGTTADGVIEAVRETPDDANVLVVVGHEPTFSGAVSRLIGGGRVLMKTATMARIDVDVETWAEVGPGTGVLAWLLPPGALKPNRYRKLQQAVKDAKKAAEKAADIATPDGDPLAPEASGDAPIDTASGEPPREGASDRPEPEAPSEAASPT